MLAIVAGAAVAAENTPPPRATGWQEPFGNGTVVSYAEFDDKRAPRAMGIAFSPQALEGLPASSK